MQAAGGTALNRGWRLFALGLWLVGLAVDQLTKLAALTRLQPHDPGDWFAGVLRLHLIFNPGAAFGMGEGATLLFTAFAFVATAVCLGWALPRVRRGWHAVVLGLLLAGITGNLVDRVVRPPSLLHGHVVDFIQIRWFAIINVADVCITVAAILLVLASLTDGRRADEAPESAVEERAA